MAVSEADREDRHLGRAMLNGLMCRCPRCGKGKLFRAFLKVKDECSECGQEFFHHRADDLPPYVAITIVGHIIVIGMLHIEMSYSVSPVTYVFTALPLAVILPLLILQPVKGAIVGLQWANRMHGFDPRHHDPALPEA